MAYSLSISVTTNSQSVANNTSNVTVKVNASWNGGTWSGENYTKYCTIDGTTHYFSDTDLNPGQSTTGSGTLFTWTGNIKHNSDGTKNLSVYAYVKTTTSSGTQTASKDVTLTTIPRKSTVSATNAVVGSNSTITISRKSSSFTHTLKYTFGSLSGTIATKTSSTSVAFTLPTSFYAQIGSTATSKSGTITCETYSGSTLVGSTTCSFTASTSSSTCAPTLSPTVSTYSQTQALTGDTTTLIRYYSTAAISFGASARNSATLSSKKVTNGSKYRTTDGDIAEVTSGTFKFTATDSRGYTTTKTITKTLIPYVKLTCSYKVKLNVDGSGTLTVSGDYFNGSFGAVSNTLTVQYRYKRSGGTYSDWVTATATKNSDNTYRVSKALSGFDYQVTYVFDVKATDKISTVNPSAQSVKALPVFDWGSNDFNHNTAVYIANGKALASRDTSGNPVNLIYESTSNNLNVGGGSYPPNNIYITAASGGNILIQQAGEGTSYTLLGLARAVCGTYIPEITVTPGANYTSADAHIYMIGNCVRVYMSALRKEAVSTGNITNETVMTIDMKHNGKVDEMYRVSFCNDTVGGLASFSAQASKIDDNTMRITIVLTASGSAVKEWNGYFVMPANLNLSAYV